MAVAIQSTPVRRSPEEFRWGVCFVLALGFHAAGAAALMANWSDDSDLVANAPVVMVDLAPVPVSPSVSPSELPPGPEQSEAQPEPEPEKPVEKLDLPLQRQAEPLAVTPPPRPIEKPKENKPKQKHASLSSAPSTADQKAERAVAPIPGASSRNSDAVPNWKSQLVARLERYKRYPSEAQSRGEHGVAKLAFSVDRSGGVHNARIVHSSGSSILDRETLTLAERAQPLPPPPPEITGSQIPIVVPIRYNAP
jgi:periplasmic protein TonB